MKEGKDWSIQDSAAMGVCGAGVGGEWGVEESMGVNVDVCLFVWLSFNVKCKMMKNVTDWMQSTT